MTEFPTEWRSGVADAAGRNPVDDIGKLCTNRSVAIPTIRAGEKKRERRRLVDVDFIVVFAGCGEDITPMRILLVWVSGCVSAWRLQCPLAIVMSERLYPSNLWSESVVEASRVFC